MKKLPLTIFLAAVLISYTLNAATSFSKPLSFTKENKVNNNHEVNASIKIDRAKAASTSTSNPFITTWETTTADETIDIPMTGSYSIDWGDGTIESITGTATHSYTTAATYTVSIGVGATRISLYSSNSKNKIKTIVQWGDIVWGADLSRAFQSCTKLNSTATDAPNLSSVTNLSMMFNNAAVFNGDISSWDVSNVTNMTSMFRSATIFNGDISSWDVSAVTTMSWMFRDARAFNQDISSWDISSLTGALPAHEMFRAVGLSTRNYDKILIGWAALATVPSTIDLGTISGLKHCAGADAKIALEAKGWTILDGGLSTNCNTWSGATDTNWATTTNWSAGTIPTATIPVIIPDVTNQPIISGSTIALSESLTIKTGATLTIASDGGLTIDGSLFTTDANALTANSSSSIIVTGIANNNIKYNRNLATTNWYLVASPFTGETIENLRDSNSLASGSDTNVGLAFYNNTLSSNRWVYQNTASTGSINVGQGYSVKLATAGDLSFSGIVNTVTKTSTISQSSSNFNLVGNPFSAYLNLGDFFADNVTAGILSEATAWFWNQSTSTYDTKTSGIDGSFEVAPAQGFFLSAGSASTTATFDIADITHQSTDAFQKTTDTRPQIKVFIKEDMNNRYTRVFYIEGTTTGFDNGYDGTIFGGANNSFQVYSELITDNNGEKLGVQALPDSGYENMVVPLGIKADSGKEVIFSSESLNLPDGIKVFLEDREANTFTRLDVVGSDYSFTPIIALNGIGRFYLHTSNSSLSTSSNSLFKKVNIYKLNTTTLRITGLPNGKSTIKLFSILGHEISSTSFESNGTYNASLPKRATGVYIVQIKNETSQLTKKIILE